MGPPEPTTKSRQGLKRRPRIVVAASICVLLVVIALAVGLGVGLIRRSSSPKAIPSTTCTTNAPIVVSHTPPSHASQPIPEAFVSFAIEFGHFPDFAGNISTPNTFSNNLLNNIGNITGTKPYIRVGGNSADEALYNPSLHIAVDRTSQQSRPQSQSQDDPMTIGIGQSFFESYSTWPDTRFIHGFNLALSTKSSADWESLLATVPLACAALGDGKLLWWEYGNEPDLYTSTTSGKGQVRATSWGNSAYVSQWLNGTQSIKSTLAQACPSMVGNNTYGYIAPSFASPNNGVLGATATWQDGLDMDEDVKLISVHNYIASTTAPGVSLQGTLLNHTETVESIAQQLNGYRFLPNASIPIILSETNSLLNTGTPGITNTFGAALWNIDYGLWCASQNISRIHMQQGTNFYYNAWQPINTNNVTIGTKPPYYGNIFVAAMLANSTSSEVKVSNIPLNTSTEAAYGAYVNGILKRIAILSMQGYDDNSLRSRQLDPGPRGQQNYTFSVPQSSSTVASVKRLSANGSDALSGITFDGYSYEYELKEGMPVLLPNVTRGETVNACSGLFTVQLMDSSAVMMEFM